MPTVPGSPRLAGSGSPPPAYFLNACPHPSPALSQGTLHTHIPGSEGGERQRGNLPPAHRPRRPHFAPITQLLRKSRKASPRSRDTCCARPRARPPEAEVGRMSVCRSSGCVTWKAEVADDPLAAVWAGGGCSCVCGGRGAARAGWTRPSAGGSRVGEASGSREPGGPSRGASWSGNPCRPPPAVAAAALRGPGGSRPVRTVVGKPCRALLAVCARLPGSEGPAGGRVRRQSAAGSRGWWYLHRHACCRRARLKGGPLLSTRTEPVPGSARTSVLGEEARRGACNQPPPHSAEGSLEGIRRVLPPSDRNSVNIKQGSRLRSLG